MSSKRRAKQERRARRFWRKRPRRVLPVYVGQCPECGEIFRDVYRHVAESHDGWIPVSW